jgi:hypothetical protein
VIYPDIWILDDIVCIPSDKIDYVFEPFNHQHPRLKFTIERERYNSISYLFS